MFYKAIRPGRCHSWDNTATAPVIKMFPACTLAFVSLPSLSFNEFCFFSSVAWPSWQWVSNFMGHQNHLEDLWKQRDGPEPQSFWFSRSGGFGGLRICISNRFPGDTDATGSGTTLWDAHCSERHTAPRVGRLNSKVFMLNAIWPPLLFAHPFRFCPLEQY